MPIPYFTGALGMLADALSERTKADPANKPLLFETRELHANDPKFI
jgi:hypothetical protein